MAVAGVLEVQMLANLARLQSDMDSAKRLVGDAAGGMSSSLLSIKTSLEAAMGPLQQLTVKVGSLESQFGKAESAALSLGKGLILGAAAGMSIDAIKNKIMGVIESMAHLKEVSEKTGASVESLSKIGFIAKQSGSDIDSVAAAMGKLSKGMAGADIDTKGAGLALSYLGLSAKDAAGNLKDPSALFTEIAKKLDTYKDGAGKAAIAQALFGKAGAEMLPTLKLLGEQGDMVAKVTDAQATAALQYTREIAKLNVQKGLLFKTVAIALLPTMKDFVEVLLDASKETNVVNGAAKGLAKDDSITNWADSGAMGLARLIDVIKIIPSLLSALAGSFKTVWADVQLAGSAATILNPVSLAASVAQGKNPFADFKAQLSDRNKTLADANAAYDKLWNMEGNSTEQAMAKRIAARQKDRAAAEADEAARKAEEAAKQNLNYDTSGEDKVKAAANDKELTSMLALIKATQDRIAVIKAQSLTMEPLTEGEKKYAELMNTSTKGYSAAAIAARDQEKALLLVEIALEKTAAARAADTAALAKYQSSTQANIDKLKEEAASTNLTGTALQKITAARAIDKAASDAIFKTKTDELGVTQQVLAVTPKMAEQILIKAAADKAETSALIEKIDAQKLSIQYEQEIAKLKEGNGLYIDAEAKAIADLDIEAAKRLKVIDGLKAESEARKKLEADYAQWYQLSMEKIGADKLNSIWQSVDQAAQTTFDNIFQGGQNAFTKLRDTLKTGLLDLLYQMTVKKWIFSIFASITGGASTLANAAGMAGSVGGGGLGTVASGASLLGNSAFGMGLSGAWGAGGGLMSTLGAGTSLLGSGTLAGIGSGLGIIAGALGPIALALAVLPSLFGHTLKDSGIQGTFGGDKGFEGHTYKYYEGGLFSSDKTDIGALDETVRKTLGDTFNAMKTQVTDFATALGLSTDKLKGFTSDVKISLKGLSDADAQKKIQEALATANNDLAQQVIGTWVTTTQDVIRQVQNTAAAMEAGAGATSSVTSSETTSVYKPSEFAHEGEKAIDTLKRLATSLELANTWLGRFGASLFDASLAGGSQASDFIDKTGGQDAFNSQASSYFNNYYTSAQKYQAAQDEIAKKLKDAGIAMPQTASEFKAAMDQFLAMGVAGQDGAAALLSVNAAFAQIHGTIGQLEQAMGVSADSIKGILDDVRKNATSAADAKKMASQKFEDSIYTGLGNAMTQGLSQMIMNAVVGPLVNGLLAGATGSAAALTAGGVAGGSGSAAGGAAAGGAVASGGAAAGAAMAQGGAMAGAAVASTIDQARTYMAGFAAIMADPTVRDTISQIAAGFGDIAASMPGLTGGASSVSSAMSSAGSSAGGMSSAVSQLGDTIDTEVKRLRGLMVTDSTNSAVSSAVLMAQFTTDTAKARAGDQTALAALAGLSQQIEAQAQLTATSSVDLARTRGWLAGSLAQTNALAKHIVDNPPSSLSLDPTLPPPGYSDQWAGPATGYSHTDAQGRPLRDTFFGYSPGTTPPPPAPDGFAFVQAPFTGAGYNDPNNSELHDKFPYYEQGTNYVPNDGLAYLHTGEAVVPAAYNKSNAGQDSAVLQELRALRSEVTSLRTQQASNHLDAQRLRLRPAKTLERWEQGGMPTTRKDGVIA